MAAGFLRARGFLLLAAFVAFTGGCGDSDGSNASIEIEIVAPQDGSSVRTERVTVRGMVTPGDATVEILGRAAQVGNGVFVGSVPLHLGSNTIDIVASAPGSTPASTTLLVKRVRTLARARMNRRISVPPLSGARNCGGGLTAGVHTSCPFAENVRAAFEQTGSGVLDVYSPTTGRTYRMYCTGGNPHVCTGGNGAAVYFSSGNSTATYNVGSCGGDLLAGPNTSCAFADNVRSAYHRLGPGWINVYSPITGRRYNMYCTASSPHVCTGGSNAAVYFP